MKKIERIREDYNIITEKDDSDTRKLTSLVRAGLFDQKKLPMLKRALEKDPSKMTMAERKALLELLDSLMSQVLHSQSVYSKVKQNVGSDMNEAVKDHYGVDPRFGNSAAVSERDMPTIIILKRKSIRVYPDNQKVGLYYSQYLDRYVAIPFGMSKKTTPFTAINEELDEAVNWEKAYSSIKKANPSDSDSELDKDPSTLSADKQLRRHAAMKKFVTQKAAEGKLKAKHYTGGYMGTLGDKESRDLKKVANKSFNKRALKGEISPLDWAAGHTGVAIGGAIRGIGHAVRDSIRLARGKKIGADRIASPAPAKPSAPEAPKNPSPPRSKGPWGDRPTQTTPKVSQKSANVSAPAAPKITSTSGKATGSMAASTAPITARVSAPKMTAPKPSKEQKRIAKLPGMGAQPTGDFKFAEPSSKTKTASYNSQTTTARSLTPLEKKTGTVNPEKQLPRKRYAGIDPKAPGTGPQPTIGKVKSPGKRMLGKLEEKRRVDEVAQVVIPALGAAAAVAGAAGIAQHIYRNKGDIGGAIKKGVEAGKENWKSNTKSIDDFFTRKSKEAEKDRAGEAAAGAAFDAKKALIKRQRADDRDAADMASVSGTNPKNVSKSVKVEPKKPVEVSPPAPVKSEPVNFDTVAEPAPAKQVTGADVPKADAVVAPKPQTDSDVIPVPVSLGTGAKTTDSASTQTQAKAKENTAEKKDKDKGKQGRGRPRFKLPLPDSGDNEDDRKFLTPAASNFKAKLNKPEGSTKTGIDTRMSNAYRKSFEVPMKEEADSEEDKKPLFEPRRFLKPVSSMNSKLKINAPKPAGVTTGVDARMRKYERDMYSQQNESVMSQIMTMVNEDVTEMQLNIGENTLKINNTIAKKVVGVYESLNKENKKKMENMLNEGTTDSFMKLINFAVRQ